MSTETRLLRLPEVLNRVPVSKSSWWQGIKDNKYPKPIKIGRSSAWCEVEINQLIKTLKSKQNGGSTNT
jgi:prophage regulatory protein